MNGDADTVDPPVKRGLLVLAVAQDDADDRSVELEHRMTTRVDKIEEKVDGVVEVVDGLKRAVYGTGTFIVTTIVVAAGAVISRL